jgi:hypothetical protein
VDRLVATKGWRGAGLTLGALVQAWELHKNGMDWPHAALEGSAGAALAAVTVEAVSIACPTFIASTAGGGTFVCVAIAGGSGALAGQTRPSDFKFPLFGPNTSMDRECQAWTAALKPDCYP